LAFKVCWNAALRKAQLFEVEVSAEDEFCDF